MRHPQNTAQDDQTLSSRGAGPNACGSSSRAAAERAAAEYGGPNRRLGEAERRKNTLDRRNEDRIAEEMLPRRNPDVPERRLASISAS